MEKWTVEDEIRRLHGGLCGKLDKDAADRVLACVNALSGLNPDAVAGVVDVLETIAGAHGDAGVIMLAETAREALATLKR